MGFLDGLLGALSDIGSAIVQALVYLFQLLVQVFEFIWQVIQLIAGWIVSVFKVVGKFFAHLWDSFFKGIFLKVFHALQSLTTWLESHLKPIINFLKAARKYIDKIYKTYVQPFLKIIQRVRQFLQILRLLHIQIAAELDKILADVQRDVQGVFLQIRGILNTAIDLLNILADPTKLLRKPTLVLSIRRTINALIRQVTGLPPGWYFPSPSKSAPKGLGFLPANFDPSNPDHNPPASYYLGLDSGVPSFDGLGEGELIGDGAVDDVSALDYFDSTLWPESDCTDVEQCISQAQLAALAVE